MAQAPIVEPISRRNSFTEELKSQMSSRRSSASSTASTSRRQSGSSLIMSRRGSYSVVREEAEEREAESPKGVADLEVTLRQTLEEQNKVRRAEKVQLVVVLAQMPLAHIFPIGKLMSFTGLLGFPLLEN